MVGREQMAVVSDGVWHCFEVDRGKFQVISKGFEGGSATSPRWFAVRTMNG